MQLLRWVGRAIGLDVHRDFCEIAICEDGVVRSAGRVNSTPEALRVLAESLLASDRVALEVTGSAWEVARILEPFVDKVIVVSPDDTGISNARAKTDRLDARALAKLLWTGELEAVWVPDQSCRRLRRRLARREQLVHARSRAKNEIHAVLMRRLQGKPPCSDLFGVKGRKWLTSLDLPVEETETIHAGLRHIAFLDAEIEEVERLIAKQALLSADARRLMTVPGVNLICAACSWPPSAISAGSRPPRQLVAYLGLDPKVRQSGEQPARSGRITKRGCFGGAVGDGRGRMDRRPPARPPTRVLSADPWPPRSRQSDRRLSPQAHDPVLVPAHPRRGLRAPAAVTDRPQDAPARDPRRRPDHERHADRDLGHAREDARRRARARRAGRSFLHAHGHRLAVSWTNEGQGSRSPRRWARA